MKIDPNANPLDGMTEHTLSFDAAEPLAPWSSFDDQQLVALQVVISSLNTLRFSLECLNSNWVRMPDNEAENAIELMREVHGELGEIFEALEEQRDESNDDGATP